MIEKYGPTSQHVVQHRPDKQNACSNCSIKVKKNYAYDQD